MENTGIPSLNDGENHKKAKSKVHPSLAAHQAKVKRDLEETPGLFTEKTRIGSVHFDKTVIAPEGYPQNLGAEIYTEEQLEARAAVDKALLRQEQAEEASEAEKVELPSEQLVFDFTKDINQKTAEALQEEEKTTVYPKVSVEVGEDDAELTGRRSIRYASRNLPAKSASESPTPPQDVTIVELEKHTSVEALVSKDRLIKHEAYQLYDFLQAKPIDPKIFKFIEKIAPRPIDYDIFWNNFELLSPEFIHNLLCVGTMQETRFDHKLGRERTIYLVDSGELDKGGLGVVNEAFMCDDRDLKLKPVLVKKALQVISAQAAFEDETEMAARLEEAVEENLNDSRLAHVMVPLYRGKDFLVLPIIADQEGVSQSVSKIVPTEPGAPIVWAKQMIGALEGNAFLNGQGIINVDFHPSNVFVGPEGGVLIDIGGFLNRNCVKEGKAEIRGNSKEMSQFPLLHNGTASLHTDNEWEQGNGNVPRREGYSNLHLLSMELEGIMPPGTHHKFSLYRIIENFLRARHNPESSLTATNDFIKLSELGKLFDSPVLELDTTKLSEADQLLYALYLKLRLSHHHPNHFINGNAKYGLDPEYISNADVHAALEEIAQLKE